MKKYTFLLVIGTEEMPSKLLKKLALDFFHCVRYEFKKNDIFFKRMKWFATSRHLSVKAECVEIKNRNIFSKYCMYDHSDIRDIGYVPQVSCQLVDKFSDIVLINSQVELCDYKNKLIHKEYSICFAKIKCLFSKIISSALNKLTNDKMMRWSDIKIPFIRPVNFVTVLLNSHILPGLIFNKNINRIIYGHKYIKNNQIVLNHADDYPDILMKKGCVIADYYVRKDTIYFSIEKQACKLGGIVNIQANDNLLEEVTASIEWPMVLYGRFDKRFLLLPNELIIHIMKINQKYFPVYDKDTNKLLPYFIFVVNVITDNYENIVLGHENVIKARFIDAEFFLKNDSRYRLEDYIPKLSTIIFHNKLGNLRNKINRIAALSSWIASQVNIDVYQAKRAGYLCKCDLLTDVVLEFPEMQGIIGMYYARRDGELESVALAQKEHYYPQRSQDILPQGKVSCIVSIADKMDTISGIFGIKEFPTGNRDPFGLKRAAVGILHIVIQGKMPLNLYELIHQSVILYEDRLTNIVDIENDIYNFLYKRLCLYYCRLGYQFNVVKSVLNSKCCNIINCIDRINSVNNFCVVRIEESNILNMVYKRIFNILKKGNVNKSDNSMKEINDSLFITVEEHDLFKQIYSAKNNLTFLLYKNYYDAALDILVSLSKVTNIFLDNVLVMSNNQDIRLNRIALLGVVYELILKVVDVSCLISPSKK